MSHIIDPITIERDPEEDLFPFIENDGGRYAAGFRGNTGDCGVRAAAIATGRPYRELYDRVNELAKAERPRGRRKRSNARLGIHTGTFNKLMEESGFTWTPTMEIGSGCQVHVRPSELPAGPLVLRLSKHYVAIKNKAIQDLSNPDRNGTRCVYGYWSKTDSNQEKILCQS